MGLGHFYTMGIGKWSTLRSTLLFGGGGAWRWELNTDPFEIIYDSTTNIVESIEGFNFADFFYLIKSASVIISLIGIAATLLSMLFISRSDQLDDKKKDIEHKLFILFCVFSLITIFNAAKEICDMIFFV